MFRRAVGTQLWHCTKHCRDWPDRNYIEKDLLTGADQFCADCANRAAHRECEHCRERGACRKHLQDGAAKETLLQSWRRKFFRFADHH